MYDYATRYEKGEVDSYHKYFQILNENGAHRLKFDCMMKVEEFEKITEQIDDFLES